jgi:hypothetical protein
MATEWTQKLFPRFEPAIRRLTEEHRQLEDEPLHLALAYLPRRKGREVRQGVFLFEVIGGFADHLEQDGELFEVTFDSVPGLPTGFDQTLHLILTNQRELERALEEGWPSALEVADAVRRDDFQVLYADSVGRRAMSRIHATAPSRKRVPRG